jgi:hypothetical protein
MSLSLVVSSNYHFHEVPTIRVLESTDSADSVLAINDCAHFHTGEKFVLIAYYWTYCDPATRGSWTEVGAPAFGYAGFDTQSYYTFLGYGGYISNARHGYYRWNTPGSLLDTDMKVRFRNEGNYAGAFLFQCRARKFGIWVDNANEEIDLRFDTEILQTKPAGFNFELNTWYWMRYRVQGSRHQCKVWQDGSAEPASWLLDLNDARWMGSPGEVGFGTYYSGVTTYARIDFLSVATGDAEPISLLDPEDCYHVHIGEETNISNYIQPAYNYHDLVDEGIVYEAPDWTDFSTATRGSWSERWNAIFGTYVFGSYNNPEWANITWQGWANNAKHYAVRWSTPGTHRDVEILARVSGYTAEANPRIYARLSDSEAYLVVVDIDANLFHLQRGTSSSAVTLDSDTPSLSANTWYWVRFRLWRNVQQAKIWADGSPEPAAWSVEAADTVIPGAGYVGVGCYGSGMHWSVFDYFSVAKYRAKNPYFLNPGGDNNYRDYCDHVADNIKLNLLPVDDAYHDVVDDFVEVGHVNYTDFSEYTTGVQPADWTERWDTAMTWTAEEDASLTGGKYLFGDRTVNGRYLLSWDDLNPQDVEILVRWKQVAAGNPSFRVVARASGGDGSEYSYHLHVDSVGDDWRIGRFLNGVHTYLGIEQAHDFRSDIFHWARFRVQGNTISAKIWDDGSAEPTAWDDTDTDGNITSGGWPGVMMNVTDIWVDFIHIATGGLSAPTYLIVNDCYSEWIDNDENPITITTEEAINLVISDAGMNYHLNVPDNVIIDPAWVYPADTYHLHTAETQGIWWLNDAYHDLVDDFVDLLYIIKTDFSEYGLGVPADWSEPWSTTAYDHTIQASSSNPYSDQELFLDYNLVQVYCVAWDDVNAVDVEVLCLQKSDDFMGMRVNLRVSGSLGNETSYIAYLRSDTNTLYLGAYVDGGWFPLTTDSGHTHDTGDPHWFRFRVEGNQIKVKAWPEGTAEPAAWDIDTTNFGITGSGAISIGAVSNDSYVWYVGVATGGLSFPTVLQADSCSHDLVDEYIELALYDSDHLHVVAPTNLTLVQTGAIDLIMSDAGMNYHLNVADNVVIDPAWVYPGDTYHDLVTLDQIWFIQFASHDHVVDPTNLTLVERIILTMSDAGMNYHLNVAENVVIDPAWVYPNDTFHIHTVPVLPATQVYPADCFHLNVVTPSDLTLVEGITLAELDSYHDLVTNGGWDIDLEQHFLSVADNFHLHVVTPTDLTLTGDVNLVMTDGGAYHDLIDPGPITIVHFSTISLVISDAGVNYHDLVDDGPFDIYPLFVTDFSEYTTGLQPNDWTERWHTADVDSTVRVGGIYGGKYLELKFDPAGGENRYRITWDKMPITETDGESLILMRAINTVWCLYSSLRIKGDDVSEDDYHARLNYYSGQEGIRIGETNNGILLNVTTRQDLDWIFYNTHYFVRFRAQGTSLKAKVWRMDEEEPSGWNREGTDSSHAAGYVGFGFAEQDENVDELHVEWYAYLSGAGTIRVPFVCYAGNHVLTDDGPIALIIRDLVVQGAYHDLVDDGPLPAAQVYPDDNYHLHVVTPTDLALGISINNAYHDLVDPGPLTTVQIHILNVWDASNHHVAGTPPVGAVGDPLDLTQLHILDPADCAHDVVDPGITLDEWELLTIEDGVHDNVSSSIDLTQWQILGMDSCYHIHAPPNVDLTQEHFLTVSDTINLHAVPTLAITQDHTLIVQGAFDLHVVEENLSIGVHLVGLDSDHISTSSTFVLTQEHSLAIAGDYLDHVADNVRMIVPITVQDNEHQVTSDLILLHQDHFLAVVGADHTHVVTDPIVPFQLHLLEVAGTGQNISYNYFVLTSDEIDFGYLAADLRGATLTIVNWANR